MKMLFVINDMVRTRLNLIKNNIRNSLLIVGALGVAVVSTNMGNSIAQSVTNEISRLIANEIKVAENEEIKAVDNIVKNVNEPTNLYALSAVLMDAESGRVLYEKDGNTVRANASTTKILTCLLAIESGKLDELVTVSKYAASMPDVQLNIKEGEQYLLKDLLYSLMLESHNDVAVAIAEHISGSVEEFSELMNKRAAEIGCENTYFITPNGLDATKEVDGEEKIHGTTAVELAKIMSKCIDNEMFLDITTTSSYTFSSKEVGENGEVRDGARRHTVNNKNALLTMMDGVLSGKTGFTGQAGYCYVCAVESDNRTYTVALLGCGWPNNKNYKWVDTKKLLSYGMEYYKEEDLFDYDSEFPAIPVDNGVYGDYEAYGVDGINADHIAKVKVSVKEEPLKVLCRDDEKVDKEIWMFTRLQAPVKEGEVVGYVRYMMEGQIVGQYNICVTETVSEKNFLWSLKCIINKFILH